LYSKIAIITRNTSKARFTLFPNPVVFNLLANGGAVSNQNGVREIYDLKGSRIISGNINLQIGNNAVNITEVDKLLKCAYTVKVFFCEW
jgi:hypothetical protein